MRIENGAVYQNNYARAAAYFIGTCASAPEGEERLAAYNLINGLYESIAADPAAIGYKPLPDVYFAPWEQQKGREKDIKNIREPIARIELLIRELYNIVDAGEAHQDGLALHGPKPGRALAKALAATGCEVRGATLILPKGSAAGLKELCGISKQHVTHITDGPQEDKPYLFFSRCVFEPESDWSAQAFDKLLDANGLLVKLCGELEARGFTRIDCRDGKRISLDYVKQHGPKEDKVKMAWAERIHSGIEVSFEELRLEPCFVWVRMPMYKTVLKFAERLPENVRDFLAAHTKNCDGCRYCVQTDKTKSRPLAAMELNGRKKCPLYPGFTMNWRKLDEELYTNILSTLDALDTLGCINK